MRANRPIGLISRDYIPIECIQNCEALFGSICFAKSGGVSSLAAYRFPPDLKIAAVVRAAPLFALAGKFGFGKL